MVETERFTLSPLAMVVPVLVDRLTINIPADAAKIGRMTAVVPVPQHVYINVKVGNKSSAPILSFPTQGAETGQSPHPQGNLHAGGKRFVAATANIFFALVAADGLSSRRRPNSVYRCGDGMTLCSINVSNADFWPLVLGASVVAARSARSF